MQYRFKPSFKKEAETARAQTDVIQQATAPNSRRTFLSAGATVAVSLPIVSTIAQGMEKGHGKGQHGQGKHGNKWPPIVPPGAISLERFKDVCTGCQICVTQCPSHVLRPTGLEYGFDYMLKPRIAYIDSYCNYECTVCSEVCPTHAIKPLTKEEKATTQVGIATFFINRCIVKTEGTDWRGLFGALPYPSRAYGSLRGHADHPASKPRSLHRLWRLRIDLSRTPDESDHHQGERSTQVRGEA